MATTSTDKPIGSPDKPASAPEKPAAASTGNVHSPRVEEVDAGKEAVLAAYNNLLQASEHFKLAAQAAGLDLKQEASTQLERGREKASAVREQASDYVHERPLPALGIAFIVGFLIAQLFGRE